MAEINVTEMKERSKTDMFKEHIQKIIFQTLGVKVSRDKAWSLFKDVTHGTVEFVLNTDGKKLPLSGVGSFEVIETKPRGSKAGLDKDGNPIEGATAWDCVPRYRFYPSSVIDKLVEQAYGCVDHNIEVKHYGIFADESANEEVDVEAEESTESVEAESAIEVESTTDEFDEI